MLAKDNRKAKKRRGSSGDDVKDEGRVLHHLCCADDLYAMAGTMNHLTRILEDKTNAIERLGMRWKEKSLTIVAGPFTEYKPGDTVEIISNGGVRWIWRVVEGMEALGTWLDNQGCSEASMWHRISKANSMFYAKKALFCDPKLPVKKRIEAFAYRLLFTVLANGLKHSLCSRLYVFGNWVSFVVSCACAGDRMRAGLTYETYSCHRCSSAQEALSTARADPGHQTCPDCSVAIGELPE